MPYSYIKRRTTRRNVARRPRPRRNPASTMARFNASRKRFTYTKRYAKKANPISETKLLTLKRYDELAPAPIQTLALAHMINFTLGGVPSSWTGFTDLQGMQPSAGTGSNQRIGSYIYLKKSHLNLEIDMKESGTKSSMPTEFRVIVYKARRLAYPAGQTRDPGTSLFLNEEGGDFGHATSGVNGTDLMVQPINRRLYTVKSDKKFMMSNPQNIAAGSASYSGHYPCMKRMSIDLPFYVKAHFEDSTKPTDVDYHWVVAIYARSLDKDVAADAFEVNTRGNTQYTDN